MGPIDQILAGVWARQQQITFIATLLLVLLGLIGIGSVIYAGQAFRLQSRQYEEEAFNREQGAVSLAWHTIAEANLNPSEIGQSNALSFLVLKSQLAGNVTLSGSSLAIYLGRVEEPLFINLSNSNLCGSNVHLRVNAKSTVTMANSLLLGTRLAGWLMHAEFSGADLNKAQLNGVRAPSASFIAANLKSATFVGGSFENADFQGADLSDTRTYRGYQGAGTNYDQVGAVSDDYYGSGDISLDRPPAVFASASDKVPGWEADDDGQAVALVDFRGARFLRADIRGADLTNSTIGQAQVDEACADQTTKLPTGVTLKKACLEESWIAERRALIQRKTYRGQAKALEVCHTQAAQPNWR
jgi:uncharacterized protein YjbI with pentapeptide repeats